MAEIIATFDTKTKQFSVTLNGKAVKNISSIGMYGSYEDTNKGYLELRTSMSNEDEKMIEITKILASEDSVKVWTDEELHKALSKVLLQRE